MCASSTEKCHTQHNSETRVRNDIRCIFKVPSLEIHAYLSLPHSHVGPSLCRKEENHSRCDEQPGQKGHAPRSPQNRPKCLLSTSKQLGSRTRWRMARPLRSASARIFKHSGSSK